jgi:PIN domain nuclease of toxin-antitoxin system
MSYLLDTHIAIWSWEDSPRLSGLARRYITEPTAQVFVSAASIWEISIKHNKAGPAGMPISGETALLYCKRAGFSILPITASHAVTAGKLPLLHADPFDRMLVAQAIDDGVGVYHAR